MKICVYCGSASGKSKEYSEVAKRLGEYMAQQEITLVYGGGRIGIMGVLARAVHENGGKVIGVIPKALALAEVAYTEIDDLRVVDSMHKRKALMEEISDAFIAMPGGFGTLDELCEIVTWAQLGIHSKPCGVLNVREYFNPFFEMVDNFNREGFIHENDQDLIVKSNCPEEIIRKIKMYKAPVRDKVKWATKK